MFIRFLLLILSPIYLLSALTLSEGTRKYDDFKISYLYDSSKRLKIDDVVTKEFHESSNQFNHGYLEGNAWFKITLVNTSQADDFILYFTEPLWEEVDLYESVDKRWKIHHAGLLTPLQNRQIMDVNPAFSLSIAQGETKIFYLKGRSISSQIGEFQVYTQKEFFRPTRFSITNMYIIYIAFLIIITLFNLYLYMAQKEAIYAYYILYVFILSVWISIMSGAYLILGFDPWNAGLHASGSLVLLLLTLFSGAFIELKKRNIHIHYLFNLFVLIFALLTIAISLEIPHTPMFLNITASIFFIILLGISLKVWKEGHIKMRYYLIALMIYMPTMGMMTLNFNNIIDNTDMTRYAFVFGSLIEVLFFNSLMVSRYHDLFNDKIRIQDELIREKGKNEEALEDEIKTRIQELEETNNILLKQTEELEKTKEQLTIQATTDPLSQLHNRRYVTDVSTRIFDSALRYNNALSIMMIDLDDFKQINDTYGHALGDDVIIRCADILKKLVRSSDIIARYGGEEFILIIPHTHQDEVLALADRIRKNIEEETIHTSDNKPLHFTLSIGLAHLQESDVHVDQMILRADKALYAAKAKGKNRIEVALDTIELKGSSVLKSY